MYRGYIGEIGTVVGVGPQGIAVRAPKICESLAPGGSISVAGVCLSAVEIDGDVFRADVSTETGHRSMLEELGPGARVNLELPLRVGDALEGHLV